MSRTWWRRGRSTLVTATALGLATTACYYTVGPEPGQLDPTFGGGDGAVVDDAVEWFTAVAPLPDGDLLVAGESGDGVIAGRYDTDGTPDADHPPAPLLPDRIGDARRVVDIAVDQAGSALLLVQHGDWPVQFYGGGPFGWSIVKLRPDGTVDAAFGDAGLAAAGPSSAHPRSIGVRPDGTIVVQDVDVTPAAPPAVPASFHEGLRTLSASGGLVGRVTLGTWVDSPPGADQGSMAIGPDGDAYVLSLGGLYRLDPTGTLTGPAALPFPAWQSFNFLDVALDGAGRAVATGPGTLPDGTRAELVVRFDAALDFDTMYGNAGLVDLPFENQDPPHRRHLSAAADGTVTWVQFTPWRVSSVVIRRITPSGTPDTSMSGDGHVRERIRLGEVDVSPINAAVAGGDVLIAGSLDDPAEAVIVRING